MNRYTNQQLSAAEVIYELWKLAQEIAHEADRGARFTPPSTTTNSPSATR